MSAAPLSPEEVRDYTARLHATAPHGEPEDDRFPILRELLERLGCPAEILSTLDYVTREPVKTVKTRWDEDGPL